MTDSKKEIELNSKEAEEKSLNNRDGLKSIFGNYKEHLSDQEKGINAPPLSREVLSTSEIIKLPDLNKDAVIETDIFSCFASRKSRRKFTTEELSLDELTYLLWATQGVKKEFKHNIHALRTVPSGGARHPFETYLAINTVEGLKPGLYRYLPFENSLEFLHHIEYMETKLTDAALGQPFAGLCAVCFIWTVIPYRTEWRYTVKSQKLILQDSGHLSQNLYLACESIHCGTCAIGAYDQDKMDSLINVDGKDEFTIYVSPVGKYEKP